MADLGSLAALQADIDAKVTTNGLNENTGARVNDCLQNIADTLNALITGPAQTITSATAALTVGAKVIYLTNATLTLPASPVEGTWIHVQNQDSTNSTIDRNGKLIDGAAANIVLTDSQTTTLRYTGGAWYSVHKVNPFVATWVTAAIASGGVPGTASGSVIAFDQGPLVYNDPETPSTSAVSFDLTGANPYTTVLLFAANATEPSWPAGVYATGTWNNNALNVVEFLYIDDDNISAKIHSDAVGAPATGFQHGYMTAGDIPVVGVTAVALTGVQFNYLSGKKYRLTIYAQGSTSSAAAGSKIGLYTSAGTGATLRCAGSQNVAFFAFSTAAGLNAQGSTFWAAAAANNQVTINGLFVAPNADGIADLRGSSNTAGQTTNFFDSSWIEVYQLD